jgi:hypothetical protein
MRWPFQAWGADVVFTGHEHHYERLTIDNIPYITEGTGGAGMRAFGTPVPGSEVRYNAAHGAMLVSVTDTSLTFEQYAVDGTLVDRLGYTGQTTSAPPLVPAGAVWKYLDNGTNQGTAWRARTFADSSWRTGNAQLGYGDGGEATTVSYGANANNKFVTTYFRNTFQVADPTAIGGLTLRLLRDDGAVVYLNGQEVARSNMPAGTVAYNTLASTAIGGASESAWHEFTVSPQVLVAGANALAVEVHQSAVTSTDISFDAQLIPTAVSATATLLPAGSAWRYHAQGANLGTAWRSASSSDSAWPFGRAELGYGDGGEATVVPSGPSNNKYITTYFRRSFSVPNAADWSGLTVRLKRDDGAVVYLNGVEVVRSNMPAGNIAYNTRASTNIAGGAESTFYEFSVPASRLVTGNNLLAVEIHQAAPTSADISFDLALVGTRAAGAASAALMTAPAGESSSGTMARRARTIDRLSLASLEEPEGDELSAEVSVSLASQLNQPRVRRGPLRPSAVDYLVAQLDDDPVAAGLDG